MATKQLDYSKPSRELLELYPEFKPAWKVAKGNVKYYIRLSLLKHHAEMTQQ